MSHVIHPGSFAFYVASDGNLMRGAAYDRVTAAAGSDPELAAILASMQSAEEIAGVEVRKVRLDGAEYFVAFVPMPAIGGAFAVAAPIKHARASRIELRLDDARATIRLEIRDDGVGFAADGDFPGHLRLRSMKERAEAVGGTLVIAST